MAQLNPLNLPEAQALVATFHAFAGDSSYTPHGLTNALRTSKLSTAATLAGQLSVPKDNADAEYVRERLTSVVGVTTPDGTRRLTLTDGTFSAAAVE
jgi:hypothetical protein